MRCLLCDAPDATHPGPCSFHPGHASFNYTSDSRVDYRDLYVWSCCARSDLSAITQDGFDVAPSISPGCVTLPTHRAQANVRIYFSKQHKKEAMTAAETLSVAGYSVDIRVAHRFKPTDVEGLACILFLTEQSEASLVEHCITAAKRAPNPPWILVCPRGRRPAESRLELAGASLADVVPPAVRKFFAPAGQFDYPLFLSYRRAELPMAKGLIRFTRAWWDKFVLSPGVEWATEIEEGIKAAGLFVLAHRDRLPSASYVWKELALARAHKKPIAILSFEGEDRRLLSACGVKVSKLVEASTAGSSPLKFKYSLGPDPIVYFPDLHKQLRLVPDRTSAETYKTYEVAHLVSFLRDFPHSLEMARSSG